MYLARMLLLAALMLAAAAGPRPAGALSCVSPEDTIPHLHVVVKGKVVGIEDEGTFVKAKRRQVRLEVERYYKGTGPALLVGYLAGTDSTAAWMNTAAVGDTMLAGFRADGKDLVSRPCDLWYKMSPDRPVRAELAAKLGEGVAPEPGGPAAEPGRPYGWVAYTAGAAVVLIAGVCLWRRRVS